MNKSTDRILTTHVGSLPRPHDLLDVIKARLEGEDIDEQEYQDKLSQTVEDMVQIQVDCGIDIVTDGEMSKPGHAVYIEERLEGYEPRPEHDFEFHKTEREAFPEYYDDYFKRAMLGGAIAPSVPLCCVGPIKYVGHDALKIDIDNLKKAAEKTGAEHVFMPCAAVTGVGFNEYYKTEEEYMFALAEAIGEEHKAIVDAGFYLQVDDPFMPHVFNDETLTEEEKDKKANLYAEAMNHRLRGIPEEKVRLHTCYGINQGPRVHEPELTRFIDHVLKVNAGGISFEAGNPRHEHEYHMWDDIKLPEGRYLIPGVITHSSHTVEHPEYVAERIIRFADRVGKENVMVAPDCGFSSQAMYKTEIHPKIVWAKLKNMSEGARIASEKLWG